MRINHNITALNTYRQYNTANNAQAKSMEKLSSGQRINKAADDAAGLSISEKMRGQIRGLDQASRNSQDGISLIQTAEGALNETHDILQRMRELAVQSSNETNTTDDRDALNKEFKQLNDEIDRIANQTQFNTKDLLKGGFGATSTSGTNIVAGKGVTNYDISGAGAGTITLSSTDGSNTGVKLTATFKDAAGNTTTQILDDVAIPTGANSSTVNFDKLGFSFTSNSSLNASSFGGSDTGDTVTVSTAAAKFQVGANKDQTISLSIGDMRSAALGVSNQDILTKDKAQSSIEALDNAIKNVSTERANLGSVQNRLEHTINNLSTSSENLTAAESRVRDVDYALAA